MIPVSFPSVLQRDKSTYAPPKTGHRAAVAASFLGWTLDAFDFFLVTYALTAIAAEFGVADKAIAFSLTLTLIFRPIGALLFGLLADRIGRKKALMANLVFFSGAAVATGLSHTYATFLFWRAIFGIGMGGEWGVGSSLVMEKAPTHRRGILSGLLQEGYATGNLLAAAAYFFVFPRFGWRAMFFVGGIPALLAFYVRLYVTESEVWERRKRHTLSEYVRELTSHWKLFLYLLVFMSVMGFVSHGTQDMYPTFLKRDWHFAPQRVAIISTIANLGAILGGLLFGHFSDRFGRRKSIITALLLGICVIPLWAFSPTIPLLILGGFVMQFMVQGAWGVIPVHINELAPDTVRGFLPGFAYQCGMAVASAAPLLQAFYADRMTYAHAMSVMAISVFSLGAIAAWAGHERHRVEFG